MFKLFRKKIKADTEFKTLGIYQIRDKFANSKKPYTLTYILKQNGIGQRAISAEAIPADEEKNIVGHYCRTDSNYLLKIRPWVEGILTLDELVKALPELQLVPVTKS